MNGNQRMVRYEVNLLLVLSLSIQEYKLKLHVLRLQNPSLANDWRSQAAHLENQIKEVNDEKVRENNGRKLLENKKNEKMFHSSPQK